MRKKVELYWCRGAHYKRLESIAEDLKYSMGVYMFYLPWKILYIGMNYPDDPNSPYNFHARIRDHLRGSEDWKWVQKYHKLRKTLIKVGHVPKTIPISKLLVEEIENLLLFKAKPHCNLEKKNKYYGRPLEITNTGYFDLLPEKIMSPNS